jgi:hypothetical protein
MIFDPIHEVPSLIKFAFIVNDENTGLDFQLIDPKQNVILKESSKSHLFHQFNATIPGEYIFTLDNKGVNFKNNIIIYFSLIRTVISLK